MADSTVVGIQVSHHRLSWDALGRFYYENSAVALALETSLAQATETMPLYFACLCSFVTLIFLPDVFWNPRVQSSPWSYSSFVLCPRHLMGEEEQSFQATFSPGTPGSPSRWQCLRRPTYAYLGSIWKMERCIRYVRIRFATYDVAQTCRRLAYYPSEHPRARSCHTQHVQGRDGPPGEKVRDILGQVRTLQSRDPATIESSFAIVTAPYRPCSASC